MNPPRIINLVVLGFAIMCALPATDAAITFTPGHIYSTLTEISYEASIMEYDTSGTVMGSLVIPSVSYGDELHGIAFGPDGFLYAVKVPAGGSGVSVLVLDSSGTVHNTYTYTNLFFGNGSAGKIALDQQYIYVTGGSELIRFKFGDPNSGVSIYSNYDVIDVDILPDGHLFVASAYGIDEIKNTGEFVRNVVWDNGIDFIFVQGIEYNSATGKLFVTQLGSTASRYTVMRLDAATGAIETGAFFDYANDLFLTESGTLLVGCRIDAPRIYNQNCAFVRIVGTDQRAFVTQYIPARPRPPVARAAVADFNADGSPDLVLRRLVTHQTAICYLTNNRVIGADYGPILPGSWSLAGAADFDGDRHIDYALFHPGSGQTVIGYLSGLAVIGAAYGPPLSPGWELAGLADFNADGKPDYVLYNNNTGQTEIWYLNNNVFTSADSGPTLPTGWGLIGVADFNGDGYPDYALFHPGTHQTAIGYLSGPVIIGAALGPRLPPSWPLVAVADFDGDGNSDFLLYNASSRQTAIGYLNNNAVINAAVGPTLPAGWGLLGPESNH